MNSYAAKVMMEIGIDISQNYPKNITNFLHRSFDYVITLCDEADTLLPNFNGDIGQKYLIHIPDPERVKGNEEEILFPYRNMRDMITEKIKEWYYTEFGSGIKSA